MKVKYIGADEWSSFENAINDFIKDKVVVDIKFQSVPTLSGTEPNFNWSNQLYALIIYKEVEK